MPELKHEQAQAVMHDKGNILVSASAGSGKTHTMIERVKRLILEQGISVNELLAVTFTESAATDMKEKLKKALSDKMGGEDDARILNQLAQVPTSDISTLHSFCGRLIRSYFFVVGVSPDFKIIDEADATVMRKESIEKVFKEFYDSGESWFYTLIDRHASGRSDEKLKELVLSAYKFCDSEAEPERFMNESVKVYLDGGYENILKQYKNLIDIQLLVIKEQAEQAFRAFTNANLVKASTFASSLIADIEQVLNGDLYAVKQFEEYSLKLDFERKIDQEIIKYKVLVTECRDKLKKLFKKVGKHLKDKQTDAQRVDGLVWHTEKFLKLVKRFSQVYNEEKKDENCLDFNDLEHFALNILKDQNVLEEIKKKYKYIFIDEYQDVNGAQEEIINRISNDNLFMVGDVKQSIYGFRGCKPEIFAQKFTDMQYSGQKTITLNDNFRSSQAVIEMVNQIFKFCMVKEYFGEDYAGRSELKPGGIYPEDKKGRAYLHFLKKEERSIVEETPRVYDILQEINKENQSDEQKIVSLIASIIKEELTKTYYDVKEKVEKPVSYSDIAILTRSKNIEYVRSIAKGLKRHGIEVVSDVKESVCDFPEIAMLINALKLIDCFKQDIPLASTLKSPIGGFSDEDLADIVCFSLAEKQNNRAGFYDCYEYYLANSDAPLKDRLLKFDKYFTRLRFLSDFIGAEGVLDKLIKEKDLESYLYAERGGKTKVNRLRRLVSAAVIGDRRLTVKEFLNKVENCADAFGFSELGDEDAVKLMTIHASKGLEFPVVIACGLERVMNANEEHEEILFSRDYGFAVRYYDDVNRIKEETILRGLIREKMQSERVKEEMRLFYVAATRAKYSLHLTFEGKEDSRKDKFTGAERFINYIPAYIPAVEHYADEFSFIELKHGVRKVLIGRADQEMVKALKDKFSWEYPFLTDTFMPLKTGVTAVVQSQDQDATPIYVLFDEPSPDIEKGNIAHKFLENFDFGRLEEVHAQAQSIINQGVLTKEQIEKINLDRIKKALNSGVFNGLDCCDLYREKAFLCGIDGCEIFDVKSKEQVVVQGVIDLLAISNDHAKIIDYKYSALDGKSLKEKYKKQLKLYAHAVEKVLGKQVDEMVLVNLFTGETVIV